MKRLSLLTAAVFSLALPGAMHAQSSTSLQTANISARANVASVVTVAGTANLNFGDLAANNGLLPGKTYAVAVTNGATTVDGTAGGAGQRGYWTVDHNVAVDFTVSVTQALRHSGGTTAAPDMSFTITCGDGATAPTSTAVTLSTTNWAVAVGGQSCTKTGHGLTSTAKTTTYVGVGGSLAVPASQPGGVYTGTINNSVAFTRY
jgi:hypothetical protein